MDKVFGLYVEPSDFDGGFLHARPIKFYRTLEAAVEAGERKAEVQSHWPKSERSKLSVIEYEVEDR